MSDVEAGKVKRSAGCAKGMVSGAVQESKFTRIWFLTFTILSFGFALVIPIGCMSPSTQYFTLFSVNPHMLAHRYNTRIANTTEQSHYDPDRLDADLVVLPDVYRVGMSGVCREFHDSGEMSCTKYFPQLLDLGALINADIDKSDLQDSAASHLREFWDSFFDEKQSMVRNKNQYSSFVQASAGLTITSLVTAPICLSVVLLMYMLKRAGYTTVATCFAIFDAVLMVAAAILWITASIKYSSDIQSALGGGPLVDNNSFWGDTDVVPLSYGLFLFAGVAIAKLLVLPIMSLLCLIFIFLLIIAAIIMAWLMFLVLQCMFVMLAACDNGTTTETVYYSTYTPPAWADS